MERSGLQGRRYDSCRRMKTLRCLEFHRRNIQSSPSFESAKHLPILGLYLRFVLVEQTSVSQVANSTDRHKRARDRNYLKDAFDQVRCTDNLGLHVEVHFSLIWYVGAIAHDVLLIVLAAR